MQNARNHTEATIHQLEPQPQEIIMNQNVQTHSAAWVTFTYISFVVSLFMVAIGIFFLPLEPWVKGYLAMGTVLLIQSCVTLTKTMRDVHEGDKMVNRLEDAKAERLLMEVSRAA
jgi:hypothetical protein